MKRWVGSYSTPSLLLPRDSHMLWTTDDGRRGLQGGVNAGSRLCALTKFGTRYADLPPLVWEM